MGTEPTEEVIALGGVQNVCIRPPKANASLAYRNAGNPPAQLVYVARCSTWRRRQDVDPNSYRRGFRFRHECPWWRAECLHPTAESERITGLPQRRKSACAAGLC